MIKIAWKNIWHKPLHATLSILLFGLGIGLVTFMLLLTRQLQDNFDKNLAEIDLVLGAKGSPLQLILCSMYHIDNPTGNIKLKEVQPFLNPNHPLIAKAIPLSIGDSYEGYRIVGTTPQLLEIYSGKIREGKLFGESLEVTIGTSVANAKHLKIGDTFKSSHGLINDGLDNTHEQAFKVVGIFEPSGTVLDQLILTPLQSIWTVHDTHQHDENEPHTHEDQEHNEAHNETTDNRAITALLVKYRSKTNFQVLNLPRQINENTNLQAALPAIEMNRLYAMLGIGEKALRNLALCIMIVSALSVFIALFNGLKERKYELSLLRVMGASRAHIFWLILAEALLLAMVGGFIGMCVGHGAMQVMANYMEDAYRYAFTGICFLKEELYIILAIIGLGMIAGVTPAIMAFRTDISKNLS